MCGIWGSIKSKKNNVQDTKIKISDLAQLVSHRGPDETVKMHAKFKDHTAYFVFHRLAIVDVDNAHQPFVQETDERIIYFMANGEIYNYQSLIEKYNLGTKSDCQVILEMYCLLGLKNTLTELDGEFAVSILDYNKKTNELKLYLVRDRFGIRPLFTACDFSKGTIYFSSEMKALPVEYSPKQVSPRKIHSFEFINTNFNSQTDPETDSETDSETNTNIRYDCVNYYELPDPDRINIDFKYFNEDEDLLERIRVSLIESVRDRLYSERPLGCLLSGGLDSSLIAGIASKILAQKGEKLNTFSIGMSENSPDILFARKVAKHINSNHHEVIIPQEEWLKAIPKIIYQIETYDTTTVRASTGQYLLAEWISKNTDIKVLLNGDGSDELTSGYLYFYNSPDEHESNSENIRLLDNIHFYDVLRVDRGISAHGLEARVPFLCHHFVDLYLSVSPHLRQPIPGKRMEKYLLRKSFDGCDYIPPEVLWRKKEAFSDGVSLLEKSWYQIIEESIPSDFDYVSSFKGKLEAVSKESKLYRKYFDAFFPNKQDILDTGFYWLPKWSGNIVNPSARVLSVYSS
jgi:asparagine synthase (glutamine-hydrolysing)